MLSLVSNPKDRIAIDAEEAGMDAFMNKPFKLDELTAVYTKLLENDHLSTRTTIVTPTSIDKSRVSGPRLIRKITPNAKIFVNEMDDLTVSQMNGDVSVLEHNETSLTVPMKTMSDPIGMSSGKKQNHVKVHATCD